MLAAPFHGKGRSPRTVCNFNFKMVRAGIKDGTRACARPRVKELSARTTRTGRLSTKDLSGATLKFEVELLSWAAFSCAAPSRLRPRLPAS